MRASRSSASPTGTCSVLSPFRLGEQPNIRVGVAMITSAPEALALHEKMAKELWSRALKGSQAVAFMRDRLARTE